MKEMIKIKKKRGRNDRIFKWSARYISWVENNTCTYVNTNNYNDICYIYK